MASDDVKAARERIAARAALELEAGQVVNLGVGLPALVPAYVDPGLEVFLHSENGIVGMGPLAHGNEVDPDLTNAGAQPVTAVTGSSYFDILTSGAMMRGGHLDTVFMGAFQVDSAGNLANWLLSPGEIKGGIGGAMDLAVGARRLIALMLHLTADGRSRVVETCMLPLTAMRVVDRIITDMAVFDVTPDGLVLRELLGKTSLADLRERTDAPFAVALTNEGDDTDAPDTSGD